MDLRIMIEPQQGASYEQQLKVAQTAEASGFGAFFRSDHVLAMDAEGLPGPTETWTTLGGIARETSTIERDPSTLTWSTALTTVIGQDDAEVAARANAISWDAAQLANEQLAGTPPQVLDRLGALAELGVSRVYLQIMDLDDLAHIEFAGSLIPEIAKLG